MKKRIIIFRFSSLGDIAMTIPVIKEFLEQNPEVEILFVSREFVKPLFENIERLTFFPADLKNRYKGIPGLYKLSKELKRLKPNQIADLHNVLRTKILRLLLKPSVKNIAVLNKARKERKDLLHKKINHSLHPMTERYADVFRNLGYDLKLTHTLPKNSVPKENAIGIAPYAMYKGKMYPLDQMKIVAKEIAESGLKVYLFGGRNEREALRKWENLHANIMCVAGKYNLKEEINLMTKLKLMISMDSANMHLASLAGTRVISIWGTTHPNMGFLGYGQSMDDVIQDETIAERPTSVYGKESDATKNIDYFKNISPELIVRKIKEVLNT